LRVDKLARVYQTEFGITLLSVVFVLDYMKQNTNFFISKVIFVMSIPDIRHALYF